MVVLNTPKIKEGSLGNAFVQYKFHESNTQIKELDISFKNSEHLEAFKEAYKALPEVIKTVDNAQFDKPKVTYLNNSNIAIIKVHKSVLPAVAEVLGIDISKNSAISQNYKAMSDIFDKIPAIVGPYDITKGKSAIRFDVSNFSDDQKQEIGIQFGIILNKIGVPHNFNIVEKQAYQDLKIEFPATAKTAVKTFIVNSFKVPEPKPAIDFSSLSPLFSDFIARG